MLEKSEPTKAERLMSVSTLDQCRTSEETANRITHAVGIVLAVAATAVLAIFAGIHGSARAIVSGSIFGATLILLYTASTLYHGARNPRTRAILQTLDHCAIFLTDRRHLHTFCPGDAPWAPGMVPVRCDMGDGNFRDRVRNDPLAPPPHGFLGIVPGYGVGRGGRDQPSPGQN
jgi:Predicted membrane protein, hemolysin III homolog